MRLNPSFSAKVHPFLSTGKSSKFGIPEPDLGDVLGILEGNRKVIIIGVHIHIGSNISDVSVFTSVHEYCKKIIARNYDSFKHVKIINLGGGLAVDYSHSAEGEAATPSPAQLADAIPGQPRLLLERWRMEDIDLRGGGVPDPAGARPVPGGQHWRPSVSGPGHQDLGRQDLRYH